MAAYELHPRKLLMCFLAYKVKIFAKYIPLHFSEDGRGFLISLLLHKHFSCCFNMWLIYFNALILIWLCISRGEFFNYFFVYCISCYFTDLRLHYTLFLCLP